MGPSIMALVTIVNSSVVSNAVLNTSMSTFVHDYLLAGMGTSGLTSIPDSGERIKQTAQEHLVS